MNHSSSRGNGESRIYKTKEGHAICQLTHPVVFYCTVGDAEMKAQLTHAEEDGTKWSYHVKFADGYKGIFDVDKKDLLFYERGQTVQNSYARAVSPDLLSIYQFDPTVPPLWLSVSVKGEAVPVWAVKRPNGAYYVHFKGNLRFFVHDFSGSWQADTADHPESYIVDEIRDAVILQLGQGNLN